MIRLGHALCRPPARQHAGAGRVVAALAALFVLLVATAAPAPAQTYGPQPVSLSCRVAISDGVIRIGCTASGFAASAVLSVTLSPGIDLGGARTDASGRATIDRALPSGLAPGDHTLQATGVAADGRTATATTIITIPGLAVEGITTSKLPRTGSNTVPLASAGSALVAAGGLLVVAARKRRTRRRAPAVT